MNHLEITPLSSSEIDTATDQFYLSQGFKVTGEQNMNIQVILNTQCVTDVLNIQSRIKD